MSRDIDAALDALNGRVLGKPGVVGTAVGLHDGGPCLVVYLASSDAQKGIPRRVKGVRVRTEVTGRIRRL